MIRSPKPQFYQNSSAGRMQKMLQVPKHVLEKLLCVQCGGYLSNGPIMLTRQGEQICGKCFKILPDDTKTNCIREVGLEAAAELLIFPCRYNLQGCTHTFQWNQESNHEIVCSYRYNTLPLEEFLLLGSKEPTKVSSTEYTCESEELQLKVQCENVYDSNYFQNEDSVKLKLEISGKNGNKISVTNTVDNQVKIDTMLECDLLVTVDTVPRVTFSNIQVKNLQEEHIYDSVSYLLQNMKCANCKKNVFNQEIFHCPFGHSMCKQCKCSLCAICGRTPSSSAQFYCKNFPKGCTQLFSTSEVKKHEIDCEFNDFKCLLYSQCEFMANLNNLTAHFTQAHDNLVNSSNELTFDVKRKDQIWYFFCYNKLFDCRCYTLLDSVEFVVKYIGSNDNAHKFRYEVELLSDKCDDTVSKKSAKCLGWNEAALGKAIIFDQRKKLKARLSIFPV